MAHYGFLNCSLNLQTERKMKKIGIITINDEVIIDLNSRLVKMHSDDQFELHHFVYKDFKNIVINEYDAFVFTNFDTRLSQPQQRNTYKVLNDLKENNYHGKIIISLNLTSAVKEIFSLEEGFLLVHDFYWQEMDKIKNFILS